MENKEKDKIEIKDSIINLESEYDVYFFDAYGVFWDGANIIQGTLDDMQILVEKGKSVIVVSNTTQLGAEAIKSYKDRGIFEGVHYNAFITSGDVFRSQIIDETIYKQINLSKEYGEKIKVFVHGKPNNSLFSDSNFEIVDEFDEAEVVYLGVPQYTNEKKDEIIKQNPKYIDCFKKSSLTKPNEADMWDSVNPEVFHDFLNKCKEKNLILLNANPDCSAPEKDKATQKINSVVRNGELVKYYKTLDEKVIQTGKPDKSIFEYTVKKVINIEQEQLNNIEEKLKIIEATLEKNKDILNTTDENIFESVDSLKNIEPAFDKKSPNDELLAEAKKLNTEKENLNQIIFNINNKKRILMIGDTEETDIDGAKSFGIDSALMIGTGNTAKILKDLTQEGKTKLLEKSGATYFVDNHQKKLSSQVSSESENGLSK